jgi:hypothetical protein
MLRVDICNTQISRKVFTTTLSIDFKELTPGLESNFVVNLSAKRIVSIEEGLNRKVENLKQINLQVE